MRKKVLFLDRDGTLIAEPEDLQVDRLDKLSFIDDSIYYLRRIADELQYTLVMVTNQDGLGTEALPEEDFWPAHRQMLGIMASQGVHFEDVCIDDSFASEGKPTRKPGTGMMAKYLEGNYDLVNSFMIGDRYTDVQFARNMGTGAILFRRSADTSDDGSLDLDVLSEGISLVTDHWRDIYEFLSLPPRSAAVNRQTSETKLQVQVRLDGEGKADISTGLGFFDHMLEQLARHSGCDLFIRAEGDLHIDEHHTIEDTALALGAAFREALGDKRGIERYGFVLPMDDALARVAIDFSGRPWLVWQAEFHRERIGDMPAEMFLHFFKSFSDAAACNLNIHAEGDNEHHKIEAIFKATARALKMAVRRTGGGLPTTKGML